MVIKFRLLLIIFLVSSTIHSQRLVDTWKTNKEHTSYLGSESVNPFIINQIQIPINTKTEASLSLSLKSNSGNTMIHKTILNNKYGGSREIEFDAIIEKDAIYFSYPFHKKLEVFIELSLNSASRKGKYNPMNWIVQDAFIEKIHDIAGNSDPFKRKEKGFNKFNYKAIDENGNTSTIESEAVFSIPFLAGINYYIMLFQNENKIISGNATLSLKVPLKLSGVQQTVETGVGISISRTKKVKRNKSFTTTIHGSVYHHELTNSNYFSIGDKKMTYKLAGLLGFNMHSRKNDNTYAIFTTLNKTSSRLSSSNYTTQGGVLNELALEAATGGNEYLELGSNYTIHFKDKNILKIELTFREDLNLNINAINKTFWGRNSEDFGVFIGFQFIIP